MSWCITLPNHWPPSRHAQHSRPLPNHQPFSLFYVKRYSPLSSPVHKLISASGPTDPYSLRTNGGSGCWSSVGRPTEMTEVSVCGVEAYIPRSLSLHQAKKPWLNHASSRAINGREGTHQWSLNLSHPYNHALYISAGNRTKSILSNCSFAMSLLGDL